MTVDEALKIIDQVTGMATGTRADHEKIKEALDVIRTALAPKAEVVEKK